MALPLVGPDEPSKSFVADPPALIYVMFFLGGFISILLGILAEVIMRTYYESQAKTTYQLSDELRDDDEDSPPKPPRAATDERPGADGVPPGSESPDGIAAQEDRSAPERLGLIDGLIPLETARQLLGRIFEMNHPAVPRRVPHCRGVHQQGPHEDRPARIHRTIDGNRCAAA